MTDNDKSSFDYKTYLFYSIKTLKEMIIKHKHGNL